MIAFLLKLFGKKKAKEERPMITFNELAAVSDPIDGDNVYKTEAYLKKINVFRNKCGIPMVATSFYRSKDRQVSIYKKKALNKQFPFKDGKFDIKKVPMQSRHLYCDAGDFKDADKRLAGWVKANLGWCKENGYYFEDFDSTPTWIHIQMTPPKSGKTVFKP